MREFLASFAICCFIAWGSAAYAEESEQNVHRLDDVVVEAPGERQEMTVTPESTVIDTKAYETIGPSTSVLDFLDTQAIIDFRGLSDLTPNEDTITMRGFSSYLFVTAIDGLTVQKTGGRKGAHIVDYALMPAFLIEKVEILPGPHSAMYDAKAVGGVINMITRAPEQKDSLKPDVNLKTSYSSYDTQNHSIDMQGSAKAFTYDVGFQKNSTDGYLRQGEADINTIFSRLGYILPMDGYVALSGSYTDANRETPVNNNPEMDDYDSDYPRTEGSLHDPWQEPTWDKEAWSTRLNYLQNLPLGKLSFGAYTSEENRDRAYWDWVNAKDHSQGTKYTTSETYWEQRGGKIMDEFQWTADHTTTVGFDIVRLYDGDRADVDERVNKEGTFLQHQWDILPSLDLKAGARYEDLKIRVSNNPTTQITTQGNWIIRKWDEVIPKSFLTWKMDSLSDGLRDTSLSAGISKIWHAPDYHGAYNPQGRPAGAWLDPEHGMGYDLIFMRRLFADINFKVDYSFYDIKDYIVGNSSYAEYSKAGPLAYSDYKINLDEVYRHGVECELDGDITKDLSFYLTHAWQNYDNQGNEPAGKSNLDDMAEHRISAGLRYKLFEPTTLMLDVQYQTEETMEVSEEYDDPDNPGETIYTWYQVDNPAYSLFDVGVKQNLFTDKYFMKEAAITCFIKNLFDEKYYDSRGYPATDRTFGASLSFSM